MTWMSPKPRRGVIATFLAASVTAALLFAAPAPVRATGHTPVVAVVSSGILPTHEAFAEAPLVGWWDFTETHGVHDPAPGDTWDTVVATPYDDAGDGTA